MGRRSTVTIAFGDGDHDFALPIGQLIELQERCDAGPGHILARMQSGAWRVEDLRETLRLGLVGAGMPPLDALKLVERYVDAHPLGDSVVPAIAVLGAAILGVEDEPDPKPDGEATPTPSPTENSDGVVSTVPEPQSE